MPWAVASKLLIYGGDYPTSDGTCVRDYVHTEDLAQAHQLAVESLEPGMGRVYNMGSGTGVTVLEVLRACEEAVGRPIPHEIVGSPPGRPGGTDRDAGKDRPGAGLVAPLYGISGRSFLPPGNGTSAIPMDTTSKATNWQMRLTPAM